MAASKEKMESFDLPLYDFQLEILRLLPVKSLVRFKSVSKAFRDTITNQVFIKMHLQSSMKSKTHFKLILHDECVDPFVDWYPPTEVYAWDLVCPPDLAVRLCIPLPAKERIISVCGSCNGIVPLHLADDVIALWNPFTRLYKILPICPVNSSEKELNKIGFGYDSVTDDYKVVKIFYDIGSRSSTKFWIYSLRSNSWNRKHFPYNGYCFEQFDSVLADGALHWLVSHEIGNTYIDEILAFDVTNETFLTFPMPDCDHKNYDRGLVPFEGCLCVHIVSFSEMSQLYVRKKHGDEITWTKMFTFSQGGTYDIQSEMAIIPLIYSNDRSLVLLNQDGTNLVWYDLEMKTGEVINMSILPAGFKSILCCESLVSPGDDSVFDGEDHESTFHEEKGI